MDKNDNSVGITKDAKNIFGRIDSIIVSNNDIIKSNSELFFISGDQNVESIYAPFDCKIIARNPYILNNFDKQLFQYKKNWIIKIKEINLNKQRVVNYPILNELFDNDFHYEDPVPLTIIY